MIQLVKVPWLPILVLSLSLTAEAKFRPKHTSGPPAREVVQRYVTDDFAGSRVFHNDKAATRQLVTWAEEPEWDQVIVVGHYTFTKVKSKRKSTKVGVRYSNLGELKGDVFFSDPVSEDATFEAVRKNGSWRVDRPILVPHISLAVAEKYLQGQLQPLDANSDRAKEITKTLENLRTLTKD